MSSLREALHHCTKLLKTSAIEDSHIEAKALLQFVTGLSTAELFAQLDKSLTKEEEEKLKELLQRRLRHEPLAYITNTKEFYGLSFYVDKRVLIPRPETELLVETAITLAKQRFPLLKRSLFIADIGTGCGAIAISLATSLPYCEVYATDISPQALEVARMNCQRHHVSERIILLQGNLLEPLPKPMDIIVANLPYICSAELCTLAPEIKDFEPEIALNGGSDGMALIAQLLSQVTWKINPEGYLILEIGQGQDEKLSSLIHSNFQAAVLDFISDLYGIKRVARIRFT